MKKGLKNTPDPTPKLIFRAEVKQEKFDVVDHTLERIYM